MLFRSRNGIPSYKIGLCTDVICGQSKAVAIEQAVRTLSPDIIACDEIGSGAEIEELEAGLCCGASFFATTHCGNLQDLYQSKRVAKLMATQAFGYIIFLASASTPGANGKLISKEEYNNEANRAIVYL